MQLQSFAGVGTRRHAQTINRAVSRSLDAIRPTSPIHHAQNGSLSTRRLQKHHHVCQAAKLEEIDPVTGEVIAATAAATVPRDSITVDGLKLTYRTVAPSEVKQPPQQLLMMHGLGSNSYAFRGSLQLMADAGYQGFAVDWVGHGASDAPSPSSFDYSEAAYKRVLAGIVDTLPLTKPFTLLVHGFVLSQYALLWALENEDLVDKLVILNSPLSAKSQLRPELAAYKNPIAFLRPKADKPFDGMNFNAAGSPYAMEYKDAQVYATPYENGTAASIALATTLDKCEWPALCKSVDDGFRTWKRPSLLVWGNKDPFVDTKVAFDFLESKRTTMRMAQFTAKLGHMPQEDYPQAIHDPILAFLEGRGEA